MTDFSVNDMRGHGGVSPGRKAVLKLMRSATICMTSRLLLHPEEYPEAWIPMPEELRRSPFQDPRSYTRINEGRLAAVQDMVAVGTHKLIGCWISNAQLDLPRWWPSHLDGPPEA